MADFKWPPIDTTGGTVNTIGTIDSVSASANGAVISTNSLILQSASATVPGLVNTSTQTMAGSKTFSGSLTVGSLSGVVHATAGLLSASNVVLTSEVSGILPVANGGTALSSLGTANQLLGVNAGASAAEYKTLSGTSNQITVTHGVGTVTLATPQNIAAASSPTFAGLTLTSFSGVVKASAGVLSAATLVNADVSATAAIVYSKLSLSNSILNADINTSAAIAYSKLSLTGSIVNADINASAAIAYSKLSLTSSIVNADISASAAIVYSKLSLSNSILNADINSAAAIVYSKLSLSNSILNADINSSAAIALNKLAATTASRALVSDASGFVSAATTTSTEIGYVNGVTSAIQTQLNGKVGTTGDESISGIKTFSTSVKLATSGGTASELNFYQSSTFTANFNAAAGSGGSSTSYTFGVARIGDIVTVSWPVISATAGATAGTFDTASATIPSQYRPTSNMQFAVRMRANNVSSDTPGVIQFQSDGTISFQRTTSGTTNFTSTQTNNGPVAGSGVWVMGI